MGIKVIGITGGIGSGKSSVANIISEAGYIVIETDKLAKQIMNENIEVKQKIVHAFGQKAYNEEGKLDAKYISSLVFNEEDKEYNALTKLNQIVHPVVIDEMMNQIDGLDKQGISKVFVESALIYEAGLEDGFDYIIVVDCSEKIVIQRLKDRYNLTEKEILLRMDSQISSAEKAHSADFIIKNDGTIEEMQKAVEFLLNII